MVEKNISEFSPDEVLVQYYSEKFKKIKETAIFLDVYRKDASPETLLNSILEELGDEGEADDESTFFDKVGRMEDILHCIENDNND